MNYKLATHNSLTSYPIKGIGKLFAPFLNLVAKCQNRTIEEQLTDGVRLFQFQIAKYKDGNWYGSHGIAWYDIEIFEALDKLSDFVERTGIRIVLYIMYDHRYFTKEDSTAFKNLCREILLNYTNIDIRDITIERNYTKLLTKPTNCSEGYWTQGWSRSVGHRLWAYLPFPRIWAKFRNAKWREEAPECEYFMQDFYNEY